MGLREKIADSNPPLEMHAGETQAQENDRRARESGPNCFPDTKKPGPSEVLGAGLGFCLR